MPLALLAKYSYAPVGPATLSPSNAACARKRSAVSFSVTASVVAVSGVMIRRSYVLALMAIIGELNGLGWGYYWSILVAGALFVYQQKLIANREREACFKAFMNNNYVGLVLFLGLAMSYWHF